MIVQVVLDVPLRQAFDYIAEDATKDDVGCLVSVYFGQRKLTGVIVNVLATSTLPSDKLRTVEHIWRDGCRLSSEWLAFTQFAARYYHAPLGQIVLQALPAGLKQPKKRRSVTKSASKPSAASALPKEDSLALTTAQSQAVHRILTETSLIYLLHGITGSGKTEVYLQLMAQVLAKNQQILCLTPEINLVPQLWQRTVTRFDAAICAQLHSGLTERQRFSEWQRIASGEARIIIGTRLAVFIPFLAPGLIIVDEEHDDSYRQQDKIRYSARDLALYRAHTLGIKCVLGSATPSMETWLKGQKQDYRLITMAERANPLAQMPNVSLVNTSRQKLVEGLSEPLLAGIAQRLKLGEQSLVFYNRRGYAPVMVCLACGWESTCKNCSAYMVVHRINACLRCHHCTTQCPIPRKCPECGNQDILAQGRGTQRIEEALSARFPDARLLRVDRDSANTPQKWQRMLSSIQHDEVDILIGTQMLAKGHDFPNLTLVGVIGADSALYSANWRAPEQLFAQLVQVSGRAGRGGKAGEVIIQSQYPEHEAFKAIVRNDYAGFAQSILTERYNAGFPPYSFQAVLRATAPEMTTAVDFLNHARAWSCANDFPQVRLFEPIPMRMQRIKNQDRGQLLVESNQRRYLHAFLYHWLPWLDTIPKPRALRWYLEIDPIEI